MQTLPSVCWVPLALLWFGQTESAMLFVVVMGTVWSVMIATDNGARNIPPIYARAARTMGSEGFHQWTRVILPASLPFLVSGMKQGWAFAWRSLMAAEIYVTILTGFGLGHLLHYGRELNAMDQVIGIMLVIVLIGLLADKVLFSPWERFLHRRWGTAYGRPSEGLRPRRRADDDRRLTRPVGRHTLRSMLRDPGRDGLDHVFLLAEEAMRRTRA